MFATPTVEELRIRARALGVELSLEEAELYREHVVARLADLDEFVQARLPEDRPPLLFPERARGRRPAPDEDPYNVWLWRCDIGGSEEGLLAGQRVSFKDHVAVAGIPLTFGTRVLEDLIPDVDATIVTRVLAAGGRVIGKNTLRGPFGGRVTTDGGFGDYWRARNPHNPAFQTGGSSSGSAAAVAAGEVDVAFGGDQRGSIRIPSATCGVVGLKPTFGLVPHTGVAFGTDLSVDHVGPIARSVGEVAAALEAVAGYDDLDPRQGRLVPERLEACAGLEGGVAGLRVGVLAEGFVDPIEPGVRDAVLAATAVLAKAGAEVREISVPEHLSVDAPLATGLQGEGAAAIRDTTPFGMWARGYYPTSIVVAWSKLWAEDLARVHPRSLLDLLIGQYSRENFHGAGYAKAQNVRPHFVRAYDAALADVDVLAMPTCRSVAVRVKAPPADRAAALRENLGKATAAGTVSANTSPFDYTGHPALAVPCGKVEGLPVSLQLVGGFFEEATLLRVAHAYHEASGWTFTLGDEEPT